MHTQYHISEIVSKINFHQINNPVTICLCDYCILCVLEGSLRIDYKNQFSHYLQTDVILLPPGYQVNLAPEKFAICLVLQIKPWFLLSTLDSKAVFEQIYNSMRNPHLQSLYPHVLLIARYYMRNLKTHEYEILSELFCCISIIQKFILSEQTVAKSSPKISGGKNNKILEYLHAHSKDCLKLQDTARSIGLTPQYIASFFQKSFGCTFMEYTYRLKASDCYYWLIYTQLSDQEISDLTGFQNLLSYKKAIHQNFGCSADDIRKKSKLPQAQLNFESSTIISNPEIIFSEPPENLYSPQIVFRKYAPIITRTDINISKSLPLSDSWRYFINLGFAYQLINPDLQNQLKEIQAKISFKYGRIFRILDLAGIEQTHGKKTYSFELIYQVIDLLISLDMIPFLDLSNKPAKINVNLHETQVIDNMEDHVIYYNKLLHILPEFIRCSCNRYGINSVKKWQFEICYDFVEGSSQLTFSQYANYFKKITASIRSIVPECIVGGPGFNTHEPMSKLENILDCFDTLEIHPDFISIYVFSATGYDENTHLSLDKETVNIRTRNIVEFLNKKYTSMPVLVSEFNSCHTARNYLNDSLFQATFLARYLVQNLEIAYGFGYFSLSDVNTRYTDSDSMLFGGNGLYSHQGIPKPAFYIYSFLKNLGTSLLTKGENYIITASSSTSFQGLFFNYAHITEAASNDNPSLQDFSSGEKLFEAVAAQFMRFRLHNVQPGYYLVKVNTINQFNGNILYNWYKSGFINIYDKKDIVFFKSLSEPASSLYTIKVTEQHILEFSIELNPREVQLLLIDYSIPLPDNERSTNDEI
jgi:beta-xylosidase/AraC-like DNA-binding protein